MLQVLFLVIQQVLQQLINLFNNSYEMHDIIFNARKSMCMYFKYEHRHEQALRNPSNLCSQQYNINWSEKLNN